MNKFNFTCPLLTKREYDDVNEEYCCAYTGLAYGLFAVVALLIVGIPFVVFICYIHRKIRNKQRPRAPTNSLSRENSSQYPYQPLLVEAGEYPSSGYGAIHSAEEDPAITSPLSRDSQQHDIASIASSRASVIPNYDEASLKHRNVQANKSSFPSSSDGQPGRRKGSRLSTDSQEKQVDQPGQLYDSVDIVSNIPTLGNHTDPKRESDLNRNPPAKPPRQFAEDRNTATSASPMYAVLEGPEPESSTQPPSDHAPVPSTSSGDLEGSQPSDGNGSSEGGDESSRGTPEYAEIEPLSPDKPGASSNDHLKETENDGEQGDKEEMPALIPEQHKSVLPDEERTENNSFERGSPPSDAKYLTVLPPEEDTNQSSLLESSTNSEEVPATTGSTVTPMPREKYEEFLLGKVRALPANRRDGMFLIRDSFSSTELKVLTMYCWKPNSNKELYNFKICFTEEGQAYLYRSSQMFSDLNGLLEYLREHKDMLPCVLATQVFPNDESTAID